MLLARSLPLSPFTQTHLRPINVLTIFGVSVMVEAGPKVDSP